MSIDNLLTIPRVLLGVNDVQRIPKHCRAVCTRFLGPHKRRYGPFQLMQGRNAVSQNSHPQALFEEPAACRPMRRDTARHQGPAKQTHGALWPAMELRGLQDVPNLSDKAVVPASLWRQTSEYCRRKQPSRPSTALVYLYGTFNPLLNIKVVPAI